MSKPFRAIAWDHPKFAKLEAATLEAVRLNHPAFSVDLSRDMKGVPFRTDAAEALVAQLRSDFNKPVAAYPENKEGREP